MAADILCRCVCLSVMLVVCRSADAALTVYRSGNPTDVQPALHGPVLNLAGGGGDHTAAMQKTIDLVRGCRADCRVTLDVVVIRASGADGYNPFFMRLAGVDSIVTFVITDRGSAERIDVAAEVGAAEVVFFAGGDQCNYIRWIRETATSRAVERAYRRGAAVGGTSAGLAILGEIAYDACPNQSAKSEDVLLDPYHEDVSLSRGFFRWRFMGMTVTDTHLVPRDRMGRLLVFLARSLHDFRLREVRGLGVNEGTSLVVVRSGLAEVFGKGPIYLIHAIRGNEAPKRGVPLTHRGFRLWRFASGSSFRLNQNPATPGQVIDVVDGRLSITPY